MGLIIPCQNLLFSATYSNEIKQLANDLLNQPELIEVARRNTAAETVAQIVYPVDKSRKRELLSHMIGANNWQRLAPFTVRSLSVLMWILNPLGSHWRPRSHSWGYFSRNHNI